MSLYRGEFKSIEIIAAVQGANECSSLSGPSAAYNSCIPRCVLPFDFILSCFHAVKCVERFEHQSLFGKLVKIGFINFYLFTVHWSSDCSYGSNKKSLAFP